MRGRRNATPMEKQIIEAIIADPFGSIKKTTDSLNHCICYDIQEYRESHEKRKEGKLTEECVLVALR